MQTPRESGWQPGQPRRRRMPDAVAESLLVLVALSLLIAGAGALMGYVIVNHKPGKATAAATSAETPAVGGGRIGGATTPAGSSNSTPTTTSAAPTTTQAAANGGTDLAAGKQVFTANCAACHTLKDANASGQVGPNLDDLKPDAERVSKQVINGGAAMPPFKGRLTPKQIEAVAKYVAAVAGKS